MNSLYNCPVLRYGLVCRSPRDLEPQIADLALTEIAEKGQEIIEAVKTRFADGGISVTYLPDNNVNKSPKGRGDPTVYFENLQLQKNDSTIYFGSSLTVCCPPNHSKIWMRYSLIPTINNGNFNLTNEVIKNFFDVAVRSSEEIEGIFFEKYREVLKKHTSSGLEKTLNIMIKTAVSDEECLKAILNRSLSSASSNGGKNAFKMLTNLPYWLHKNGNGFADDLLKKNAIQIFGLSRGVHNGIFIKTEEDRLIDFVGVGYSSDSKLLNYKDSVSHILSTALIDCISEYM